MSTIDQQFVEFIVKSVVGNPDAVQVTRKIDERGVLLELTVDPQDLGRVIGKRGAGAQALRTLLRALGTKNDARYNLKIVDNGDAVDKSDNNSAVEKANNDPDAGTATTQTDEPADEDDAVEENSRTEKTRRELEELDDLDI